VIGLKGSEESVKLCAPVLAKLQFAMLSIYHFLILLILMTFVYINKLSYSDTHCHLVYGRVSTPTLRSAQFLTRIAKRMTRTLYFINILVLIIIIIIIMIMIMTMTIIIIITIIITVRNSFGAGGRGPSPQSINISPACPSRA
jgi:hypothetical protein